MRDERSDHTIEIERLTTQLGECKRELDLYRTWALPGHALSPIPSLTEVKNRERLIYQVPRELPGIDLNEAGQLRLFDERRKFYDEQPCPEQKTEGRRYWFQNPAYSYSDAILLYCLMRHLRPRKIIEVGSGYSSCAMLDTNEIFFDNSIECTFIDPQPELLYSLVNGKDLERNQLLEQKVQEVDLDLVAR